ncbi:energy transducer TonB [Simonsiella muelleri]|uniref:energy transducer TonB n=1 Tax=Simonsiella muelleri TaxID=72 RepID=UPI00131A3A92|nr:energy transducer TonB [Simonsiella muelleri]
MEKPIEKIKPAEKPIEKPVEKPKPQIDEAKLAAERAERIAAEKAAAEKAAAEKAAQNAARAAAEKAAREAAGNGNGNDSSSNNRSGSINGGKNGITGGEGRTGNASNPKGKGVGDGDGDHSKGKNKGNGNGGDGNKSSSRGGIADGGVISRPAPEYPAASIENEEEGTVSIEIIVEANGSVSSARIAKSSGHNRLDNAALRAFKAGRYKPKSDDGTPIRTRFIVKTNFSLNE